MTQQTPWQVAGNAAEVYEEYLVPAIFEPWARELLERAVPRPGERVLDVACGTGIVARLAADRVGTAGKVLGVDINPGMIAAARRIAPATGAEWKEGSATALPLPDGSFDLVTCQQGLQFFPDRLAALREMHRVLTPTGRIALASWRSIRHSPGFQALAEALGKWAGPDAAAIVYGPFALAEEDDLRSLLAAAGFRDPSTARAARVLHFPSSEEFVRRYGAGSPLAGTLANMTPSTRGELIREVTERLAPHVSTTGLEFPIEANLAVAYK
jgi:ubiquinone/menaquinone biosynthesis C-methylase UbiE